MAQCMVVETAIPASIVYMALENIRRWIIAGLFGLVHGFGFADILKEQLQFAGSNLLASLLLFNIGVEIGQVLGLCTFVLALALLFRGDVRSDGNNGVGHLSLTGWHWMLDRADVLWQRPLAAPTVAGLMVLARWIPAVAPRS